MRDATRGGWPWLATTLSLFAALLAQEANANTAAIQQQAERELLSRPLTQRGRAKVREVVRDACFFRRPATDRIQCDPDFYRFVLNCPDVVVDIWRILGVSDIRLRQIGPDQYYADDGSGTTTRLEYLHRGPDSHIVLAEGSYTGPLSLRTIRGTAVLHLQTSYSTGRDGKTLVTHRLDVFVQLQNLGAELLVRGMGGQLGTMTDKNFREVSAFLQSLCGRIESDPDWTSNLTNQLTGVRDETRVQFAHLTTALYAKGSELGMSEDPPAAEPSRPAEPRSQLAQNDSSPSMMPLPDAAGVVRVGPASRPTRLRQLGGHRDEPAPMETASVGELAHNPVLAPNNKPLAPYAPPVPVVRLSRATPDDEPRAQADEPMTESPAAELADQAELPQASASEPPPSEAERQPALKGPLIPGLTTAR